MNAEVHIDWRGRTHFVGRLHADDRSQAVTFVYTPEWLRQAATFAIDPTSLPLRSGPQHSAALFGALLDCGPDRWGRVLIERAVRKKVLSAKPYRDIDFVLALDDFARIGALRFRLDAAGPFLAAGTGTLPPLVRLSALLRATEAIHSESETAQDLRFLLGAGSPLGGARPKCAVSLGDGRLGIAKFPKPDDTRDIAAGEVLALSLAQEAGIRVAEHRLVPMGAQSVAVITRFDRQTDARIPFISAASLLGQAPGAGAAYTQVGDAIRQFGHNVTDDLHELWRRLIFSLLASNFDDHLRNHGFLMLAPGRWSLSPAYDLNPTPEIDRARASKTSISEVEETPSMAAAMDVAPRFGLEPAEAKRILRAVYAAVSGWRSMGRRLRIKAGTLAAYASAFEQPLMEEAGRMI